MLELVDEAGRKVFQIAEARQQGDLRSMQDLMDEALTLLDTMKKNASGITGTADLLPALVMETDRLAPRVAPAGPTPEVQLLTEIRDLLRK